eukprot:422223_1
MCDVYVMGQDGIYFPKARNLYYTPYQNRTVILPPGSRADLAIRCRCNKAVDENCVYQIYASSHFHYGFHGEGAPIPFSDIELVQFEVTNDGYTADDDILYKWEPQPYNTTMYLKETRYTDTDAFCAQGTGFEADEMSQCNIVHGRIAYPAGGGPPGKNPHNQVGMNQVQFHKNITLAKVCTGNDIPHEWMVTSNFHPFHHHTWPFQLQRDITDGWIAKEGDWRDTVGAEGTFRMRSNYYTADFRDYNTISPRLIMHCHYVPHEDHGMMQQVELVSECSTIKNDYIIPPLIKDTLYNFSMPVTNPCTPKTAISRVNMLNVDAKIDIILNILGNCYHDFTFKIIPRSKTVGNLWIGIGIGSDNFDKTNPNSIYPKMSGNGLVISFLATGIGYPLNAVTWHEIDMDYATRAIWWRDNFFKCPTHSRNDNVLNINCKRPFNSDTNSQDSFNFLNDGDKYFIIAYGEGQFVPNKTYHSARGHCAFSYGETINCTISQSDTYFQFGETLVDTTEKPTEKPTEFDDSSVVRLNYFLSMLSAFVFLSFSLL